MMEIWQYLLILAGGLLLVFAACLLPGRFFRFSTSSPFPLKSTPGFFFSAAASA